MLRLRGCLVSQLLSPSSSSPVSHLHRLLSATAPPVSPNRPLSPNPGFAVEDYLVGTCSLTRAQALKASTQLSHLKSPANPDAVLAILAGLSISSTDVAATVAKDPKLLCTSVERTLAPKVAGLTGLGLSGPDIARLISLISTKVDKTLAPVVVGLTGLGLSSPEIARLVSIAPDRFRCRSVVSMLRCYLSLFGSVDKLLAMVERRPHLLSHRDKVVELNLLFLRECGLDNCDIAKLCIPAPRILSTKPERVRAMVACAEGIGVPRGSGMFRQALQAVAFLSEEKIAAKVDFLKKTFRWSDAQVSIALSKAPIVLRRSKDLLRRASEFLISEVGLEPVYVAHRPVLLNYSMEGRLRPRYYVLRFLKANGLIDQNRDYYITVSPSEEVFVKKFICPHKEAAPHLTEDYEAACRGEVPARFRFT